MASTKRSRLKVKAEPDAVTGAVAQAWQQAKNIPERPVIIALSGGRDSMALLEAAWRQQQPNALGLMAVHVHHGLHPDADQWAEHCQMQCAQRGIEIIVKRVHVSQGGDGLEANARDARYEVLTEVAQQHHAQAVWVAHHLDDRIETFLLQWLRGAGLEGLAAFPYARALTSEVQIVRPLIHTPRADIERYCTVHALSYIDDPSNTNVQHARNALRQHVMPEIETVCPSYRQTAARSIDLLAESAQLILALAQQGMQECTQNVPERALRLDRLRTMNPAQQAIVLRHWLATYGIRAPSRIRLQALLEQTLNAQAGARVLFDFETARVRRYRNLLWLLDKPVGGAAPSATTVALQWSGQAFIEVPQWRGRLVFESAPEGFERQWLSGGSLQLRPRVGGERLRLHAKRPSKSLKQAFQEAGIAPFERPRLPLVWRDDTLIFVAGLGADACFWGQGGDRVALRWVPL